MDDRPVIVLTGATSGLGKLATLELARRGARLGIVARDPARAETLRRDIDQIAPGTPGG